MAVIASLNTVFGADTKDFSRGVKRVSKQSRRLAQDMKKNRSFFKGDAFGVMSMKKAGLAITGLATGVVAYTRSIGRALDETAKFSRRIGINIVELQKLQLVNEKAGETNQTLANGLQKLQRAIVEAEDGVATYADAFDKLGLKTKDLLGMSPDEQFKAVAQAMEGVGNETERTATAMDIFGNRGAGLINTMKGLNDELAKIEADKDIMKGMLSAEQVARFEEVNDQFADLGVILKGSVAENLEQINFLVKGFATVTTGLSRTWSGISDAIEGVALRLMTNSDELEEYNRRMEKQRYWEEAVARSKEIQAKKAEEEARKEQEAQKMRLSKQEELAKTNERIINSEKTKKQLLFDEYRQLTILASEADKIDENTERALEIYKKRIDALNEEEAQKKKILALDEKIAEQNKKVSDAREALSKSQTGVREIGFGQSVSKGVTSGGLVSGQRKIGLDQLKVAEKQLKVAEDQLEALQKERVATAS